MDQWPTFFGDMPSVTGSVARILGLCIWLCGFRFVFIRCALPYLNYKNNIGTYIHTNIHLYSYMYIHAKRSRIQEKYSMNSMLKANKQSKFILKQRLSNRCRRQQHQHKHTRIEMQRRMACRQLGDPQLASEEWNRRVKGAYHFVFRLFLWHNV